jgi:hypothetical protein
MCTCDGQLCAVLHTATVTLRNAVAHEVDPNTCLLHLTYPIVVVQQGAHGGMSVICVEDENIVLDIAQALMLEAPLGQAQVHPKFGLANVVFDTGGLAALKRGSVPAPVVLVTNPFGIALAAWHWPLQIATFIPIAVEGETTWWAEQLKRCSSFVQVRRLQCLVQGNCSCRALYVDTASNVMAMMC